MFKYYVLLHLVVFIWGFTAILGKLIQLPTPEMVFYRTLLAAIGIGIFLGIREGKKAFFQKKTDLKSFLSIGAILGLHWILFFGSAYISNVSISLAGASTASLWTAILEPILTKKKIKLYEVFLGVLIIGGLYTIFLFEFNHINGILVALASAFFAAVFAIYNVQFAAKHSPYVISFYEMIGAFLFVVAFLPVYAYFSPNDLQLLPSPTDWGYLFVLSTVCTVFAYSASVKVAQYMSAFTMNLAINMEPIYGITMAALLFNEQNELSKGFYGGTLLILLAIFLHPVFQYFERRRQKKVV